MGLDMYLYKTKKVDGFTAEQYERVDSFVCEKYPGHPIDLEAACGVEGSAPLAESINQRGTHIHWYSILTEIGYWRKANQVHGWFVDNVQGGLDECQLALAPKEKLEELLAAVNGVLSSSLDPEESLPTQSGFFFGNTEYNEWYFENLRLTRQILEEALANINFDEEVVLYRSSW